MKHLDIIKDYHSGMSIPKIAFLHNFSRARIMRTLVSEQVELREEDKPHIARMAKPVASSETIMMREYWSKTNNKGRSYANSPRSWVKANKPRQK